MGAYLCATGLRQNYTCYDLSKQNLFPDPCYSEINSEILAFFAVPTNLTVMIGH